MSQTYVPSIMVVIGPHAAWRLSRARMVEGTQLTAEETIAELNSCSMFSRGVLGEHRNEEGTYVLCFRALGALFILKPIEGRIYKAVTYVYTYRVREVRGREVGVKYALLGCGAQTTSERILTEAGLGSLLETLRDSRTGQQKHWIRVPGRAIGLRVWPRTFSGAILDPKEWFSEEDLVEIEKTRQWLESTTGHACILSCRDGDWDHFAHLDVEVDVLATVSCKRALKDTEEAP